MGKAALLAIIGLAAISVVCLTIVATRVTDPGNVMGVLIGFIGPVVAAFLATWMKVQGLELQVRANKKVIDRHMSECSGLLGTPPDNPP